MRIKGIDVSGYNVVKDYKAVANDGVDFAILKVIKKDLTADKLFETHWSGFEAVGVPIQGVYNYSYATNAEKAKTDAKAVIHALDGRKTMVWLDVEDNCLKGLGHGLIDIIKAYANVIIGSGLQFGIYTYVSFYNSYIKQFENELNYPFWIARYPSTQKMDNDIDVDLAKCPQINKTLFGWQYSSKGVVNGIVGDIDLDEWFVDIEAKKVATTSKYTDSDFRRELALSLGLTATALKSAVLAKTVTISASKNKHHKSVTPLERLLKEKGYYNGDIEEDKGKIPTFGNGMAKATALYQSEIVGLKKPDKEWTGKTGKSYKTALGI